MFFEFFREILNEKLANHKSEKIVCHKETHTSQLSTYDTIIAKFRNVAQKNYQDLTMTLEKHIFDTVIVVIVARSVST